MLDTAAFVRCLDGPTQAIRMAAHGALMGDAAAVPALHDALVEHGEDMETPFKVGEQWFICTVTLYYVGRVKAVGFGFIELEEASWVHWTGRLSLLTKRRKFSGSWPNNRKPRVEPITGRTVLALSSIVSAYDWPKGELPGEAIE